MQSSNPKVNSPAQFLDPFLSEVGSIASAAPKVIELIGVLHQATVESLYKFADEHGLLNDTGKAIQVRYDDPIMPQITSINRKATDFGHVFQVLPPNLVVAMVSRYDVFIADLVRYVLDRKPDVIDQSDSQLSYRELIQLGSIDAATEHLIERQVEKVLRESHSTHFEWLSSKVEVKLKPEKSLMKTFIELTERRNLFVHTDGIVSQQYLKICEKHGVAFDTETTLGTKLKVIPQYWSSARDCLIELATELVQVIWRKLEPNCRREADQNLIDVTFQLLSDGNYVVSKRLLEFAVNEPAFGFSDESNKRVCIINLAQSYKWLGHEDRCSALLKEHDWSFVSDVLKLAHAVLSNDFSAASTAMQRVGQSGEVGKRGYRDWPLFKEFRESSEFGEAYELVFGEPFSVNLTKTTATDLEFAAEEVEQQD